MELLGHIIMGFGVLLEMLQPNPLVLLVMQEELIPQIQVQKEEYLVQQTIPQLELIMELLELQGVQQS